MIGHLVTRAKQAQAADTLLEEFDTFLLEQRVRIQESVDAFEARRRERMVGFVRVDCELTEVRK